ncbi:uncharacterized protein LOC110429684 isoform X1 [Sorghum bicolor]|uniref:uncharacterized protein LOC110429684 isoform X1 n=1 Tax=Sorghum bicolor TaxID=4558 RepID=UPI000B426A44|nr:uncharacterized protein LOC110429684 isoform X1 [Sorghum bicolor]|eukprot:XP_021301705.1 uncharacterized protein LOC110429684 isoform X1 [Sorghum bicolor]
MINLFELSVGASAKVSSRDGSPVRGTQSERKEYVGSKAHDLCRQLTGSTRRSSSDRSGGTPMKMLIAQEMAKEGDANQKTTNVVARLMGLDDNVDLPKHVVPSNRRSFPDGHLSATMARVNNQISFEKHTSSAEDVEYKDVYEVGYQPPRGDEYPRRRPNEDHDKRRMDLVRQKFVEAKRLASHDNILQSKEFHDALEVLNSNKDLFLKFLEEPNSLFTKQSGGHNSAPTSPQRKRITVLKPSKSVELKGDKAIKRMKNHAVDGNRIERSNVHKSDAAHVKEDRLPKHTRIVVLKPTSVITSTEQSEQNYHADLDDSEAPGLSRHLSDEIDWSVHGICRHHTESLQGCIQSNLFSADRPYHRYAEEESDSDIGTPTSHHSWEYIYQFSNPYFGSLSHASCSPESHVTREAKKHASDRWAIVPSSEISQQKVPVRRSLSTLGEMLAMPDMKKEEVADQASPDANTHQLCEPTGGVSSNSAVDEGEGERSLRKISRSRSVPVSSTAFDSLRLDGGRLDAQHKEPTVPKEVKPKNGKSSLKGKITSFFSKRKKAEKEKANPSPLGTLNSRASSASTVAVGKSDVPQHVCTSLQDDVASENLEEQFNHGPIGVPVDEPEAPSVSKSPASHEKALSFEIRTSHFDQPSPTSVLDLQFEDISEKSPISSESAITAKQEPLSRSLPIGSIARTLSWDDASQEAPLCSTKGDNLEQEQYEFVEKTLTSAGFCNEKVQDIFVRWHSLDCPLNPAVLDQLLERKVEDAKCRERRSNQRLLIDSVNAALLDIGQSKLWGAYPCTARHSNAPGVATCDVLVTDEAWRLVKSWLFDDENDIAGLGDYPGLAADWVVGKEINGKGWPEMLRLEVDEISKEICEEVLGELVGEAFSQLADH